MSEIVVRPARGIGVVAAVDGTAKAGLVAMLAVAVAAPELGNMADKAAGLRAIAYPVLAFALPAAWYALWRERASFPWVADLLVTLTCFTDILGNHLDLYDRVWWFDDCMHLMNVALLAAAWMLLTMDASAGFGARLERSLALGMTAGVWWEIAEYAAFVSGSSERRTAYGDTLGDLAMGCIGAVLAAYLLHRLASRGRLHAVVPLRSRPAGERTAQLV
jgi:hypothetical protein